MPQFLEDPEQAVAANIAAFGGSTTTDKINNLQNKKQEKVNGLSSTGLSTYSDAILKYTGDDGDGFTTVDPETGLESTYRTAGTDAIETKHGNHPYDMYGVDPSLKRSGDPKYKYRKSALSMDAQRQGVADIINQYDPSANKTADNVTESDMLDIASMNKVQQLSDIMNGNSEWRAPYVKGGRVQLGKELYGDGEGMGIHVKVKGVKKPSMSRTLGYLATDDGVDLNKVIHNDKQANTGGRFQYQDPFGNATSSKGIRLITDADLEAMDRVGNTDDSWLTGLAKGAASTVVSTIGQAEDAIVNDLPDWAIAKTEEAYYDHQIANADTEEEKAKLEADKKDALGHSYKMNGVASWLGGNGYDDTKEYYKSEDIGKMTDSAFGVNTAQAQREQLQVEEDVKKGNYGTAAWHAMSSGNISGNIVGSVATFWLGVGEIKAGTMVASNSGKIAKAYAKANEMLTAGKTVEAAKLMEVANKRMNVAQKILAKGIEKAGATAMFTGMVNDTLGARNKAEGQQHAGLKDIAIAIPSAALQTYVGLESAKILTKPIVNALKESASLLGKKATDQLWKKVLKTAGRVGGAFGKGAVVEGTEEYVQQWADILGKQWSTGKKGDDVGSILSNSKNQLDAKVAGIEGVGGGHIGGAAQVLHELGNVKMPKRSENTENVPVVSEEQVNTSRAEAGRAMTNMAVYKDVYEKLATNGQDTKAVLDDSKSGKPGLNTAIDGLTGHLKSLDAMDSTPEVEAEKEKVVKHLQEAISLRRKASGESEALGNRDPKEVAALMAKVENEIATVGKGVDTSGKQIELAKLAAEKLVSEHVFSKDFDKVDINDKASGTDSLKLKLVGGTFKGKKKLGMLEYVDMALHAKTEDARQYALDGMNAFMSTQSQKIDAFKSAKEAYTKDREALDAKLSSMDKNTEGYKNVQAEIAKLKKPVKYAGSNYEYRGGVSEGFTNKLVKEHELLQKLAEIATNGVKVKPSEKPSSTPWHSISYGVNDKIGRKIAKGLLTGVKPKKEITDTMREEFKTNNPKLVASVAAELAQKEKGQDNGKQNEEAKVTTEEKTTTTGTKQDAGQSDTQSGEPTQQEELTPLDKEIADLEVEIGALEKDVQAKVENLKVLTEGYSAKGTMNYIAKGLKATKEWAKDRSKKLAARISKIDETLKALPASDTKSLVDGVTRLVATQDKLEQHKDKVRKQKDELLAKAEGVQTAVQNVRKSKIALSEKRVRKEALVDERNLRDNHVAREVLAWTEKYKARTKIEGQSGKLTIAKNDKGFLHEFFKAATQPRNNNAIATEVIAEALSGDTTLGSKAKDNLEVAQKRIKTLRGAIASVVNKDLKGTTTNMVWFGSNGEEGFQGVSRMLMTHNGTARELNDKVEEALAASTLEALMDTVATFEAGTRDDNAVRSLKGMDSNAAVGPEDRASVAGFDGIMDFVASNIGEKAWSALGLTAVKEGPEGIDPKRIEQKVKAELGMIGVLALENRGLIKLNDKARDASEKTRLEFIEGKRTPAVIIYDDESKAGADVVTYSVTAKGKEVLRTGKGMAVDLAIVLEEDSDALGIYTKETRNEMEAVRTEHQGVSKLAGTPAKTRVEAVENQDSTELHINQDVIELMYKLDTVGVKLGAGKDESYSKLDGILGKINPDRVYVNERTSTKGKNNAVDRQKKLLSEVNEATEKGKKPFWQKWRVLTNFRFGVIGGKFDHQAIKLHRFATDRGSAEVRSGSKEETILKLAIGQGLGVDVDKLPMDKSVEEYDKLESAVRGVFGDKVLTVQEASAEQLGVVADALNVHDEHGLRSMAEILKYMSYKDSNSDEAYVSTITLETDAVTSGYILKMLQMPIFMKGGELDIEKTFGELERGGVMRVLEGEEPINYSDLASDTTKRDAYQQPAHILKGKIDESKIVNIMDGNEIRGVILKPVEHDVVTEKDDIDLEWNRSKDGKITSKRTGESTKLKAKKGETGIQLVDPVLFNGKAYVHPALAKGKDIEGRAKGLLQGMEAAMELLGEGSRDGLDYILEEVSRAFMKQPFMVLNYGSGMKGIINSIAKRALSTSGTPYPSKTNLNALMTTIAGINADGGNTNIEVGEAFDLLSRALKASAYMMKDTATGKRDYEAEAKIDAWLAKVEEVKGDPATLDIEMPAEFYSAVKDHVAKVIGKPIRDAFEEQYGELIKATRTVNSSVALMGRLALKDVDKKIAEATAEKNSGRDRNKWVPLTTKEVDKILKANKTLMPVINMALDDGNGDQMVLFKTAKGDWTEGAMDTAMKLQASVERVNGDTLNATSAMYKMVVAYTSGAVMPIHALDASIQSQILAKWKALGVHDANFGKVNEIVDITKGYNTSAYTLSRDWSMTTEILESMYVTLNGVSSDAIQEVETDMVMDYLDSMTKKLLEDPTNADLYKVTGDAPVALEGLPYAEKKAISVELAEHKSEIANAARAYVSALGGDLADAYNGYINTISEIGMTDDTTIAAITLGRMDGIDTLPTMNTVVKDMEDLQKVAEKGRKVVFEADLQVEHSALDGAGVRFDGKEEYVPKVPNTKLDRSKLPSEMTYEPGVDTPLGNRAVKVAKASTNPELDKIADKILDKCKDV